VVLLNLLAIHAITVKPMKEHTTATQNSEASFCIDTYHF